ncbi:MAG TPA: DUF6491 family protein [Allosphingosinicella sp.]|nr:DUF6491 family protein [Allosphingosinicella sp.]
MKHSALAAIAALAAGCAMEAPVEDAAYEPEGRVAEALAGRTAGEPVDCVDMRQLRSNRSLGDNAMLFEGPGDIVYLNRPSGGCQSLEFGRSLRTRTTSTRLCRGDIVTVFDPVSGVEYGGCGLGDFVPYRRPR